MQTRFEQYFATLKNKKIAVLGLGVSNRPLVRLLLEFGCTVIGCDRTPREKLDDEVLELERAAAFCAQVTAIWMGWRRMWYFAHRVCTPIILLSGPW